jgi:hypothetical protein
VVESHNTDARVLAIFQQIGNRILGIKESRPDIIYPVILTELFGICVRLWVLERGSVATLKHLEQVLAGAKREHGIPATAIMGTEFPQQPAWYHDKVGITLWHRVQDLNSKGYDTDEIAAACANLTFQLAEKVSDKWLACGIIKNAHNKLSCEPAYAPTGLSSHAFLVSLKEQSVQGAQRSGPSLFEDARKLLEWEIATCNVVKSSSENPQTFRLLAAACFALHQDMKKAMKIDLWRCDDVLQAAIEERGPPPAPGGLEFPDRLLKSILMLKEIGDSNLDISEQPNAKDVVLKATFRANAAAIWLLTATAKTQTANIQQSNVIYIWLLLGMVSAEDLIEPAKLFTGSYFDGISCGQLALEDWPKIDDPNIFLASVIH